MIRRKSEKASEFDEQCALAEWVETMQAFCPALEMFAAHPNGGVRPFKFDKNGKRFCPEGQRLKRMGVKAGYPDCTLMVPSRSKSGSVQHGLAIELKVAEGSPSKDQLDWQRRFKSRGYRAEIVVGWVRAARLIVEYLDPTLTDRERRALHAAIPMS